MIKLFKIDELESGVQRFQSQLLVGSDVADFILDIDGVMKVFRNGKKGLAFYEYKEPYQMVEDKLEMRLQLLQSHACMFLGGESVSKTN